MIVNEQAADVTVIGVAIVRDKQGNPKFDDPHNVPQKVIDALTPKDLEYLERLKCQ